MRSAGAARLGIPAVAALALALCAPAARAAGGYELDAFEPAPAGDVFFGVSSPFASGHLAVRGHLVYEHALDPLRFDETTTLVTAQAFTRADVSLALWDRLLVSVHAPLAVVVEGNASPLGAAAPASGPGMGDVRIGARGRLFGENTASVQLGAGGYFFVPSGDRERYLGEGVVRGALALSLGGRAGTDVVLIYAAAGGAELRGFHSPHQLTYGAGLGLLFARDLLQISAELSGTAALGDETLARVAAEDEAASVPVAVGSNVELLAGGKLRLFEGLTFGAAAGPGLVETAGTPSVRAVALIGWAPLERRAPARAVAPGGLHGADRDQDGIPDDIDACPSAAGEPNADPERDGCPEGAEPVAPAAPGDKPPAAPTPDDRDGDGIPDRVDACPTLAGTPSKEPTIHGCPPDRDGDGVPDDDDACPYEPGPADADPRRPGCPR
jgi:hypothetical protein